MAEPIPPYRSGRLGDGALGYMTPGAIATPLTDFALPYELGNRIWVEIYTPLFVMSGIVGDYESLTWIENWYDFHTWELAINSAKINVSAFEKGGIIRFVADGVERIGWIEGIKRVLDAKGSETHTVSGRGIEAIFAQRDCETGVATGTGYNVIGNTAITGITFTFAASTSVTASADCRAQISVGYYLYNSTNDIATSAVRVSAISTDGLTITLEAAYAGTAGSGKAGSVAGQPAETAMQTVVTAECISATNTARRLSGLTLATDLKRGKVVSRTLRFDRVSDVLYSIAKESQSSFKLAHLTAGMNFVFTYLVGSDVSDTVTLSTDYGNVKELEYFEDYLEYKNLVKVLGPGDGAARLTRDCWTGTTEPSGWTRKETTYDASDCTTDAAMSSKGAEVLADLGDTTALNMQYLQTPTPTYILGTHFGLGDTIKVDYVTAGVIVISRITSIETGWTRDSKMIKLTIGKSKPDFVNIYKYDKKQNGAQKRR